MFWVHFQRRQSCRVCRNALGRTDFSQAKVENLGVAALGHKNIRGLDVTVNDALGVCGVQSIGHVNCDSQECIQLHWTACNNVLERLPIQKFHGNESSTILLTDVVNGADVRVVQRRSSLRFPLEAR